LKIPKKYQKFKTLPFVYYVEKLYMKIPGSNLAKLLLRAAAAKLPAAKRARAQEAADKAQQRKEFLKDRGGVNQALQYHLEQKGKATIGKAENNNIGDSHADNPQMSSNHAEFSYDGKQTTITDLNSTNGTHVKFYPQKGESIEITAKADHGLGSIPLIIQGSKHPFYLVQEEGLDLEKKLASSPLGATIKVTYNKEHQTVEFVEENQRIPDYETAILEVKKVFRSNIDSNTNGYVFTSVHEGNFSLGLSLGLKQKTDPKKTLYAPKAVTNVQDMDIQTGNHIQALGFGTKHPNSEANAHFAVASTADHLNLLKQRKN
jgi:hypothetical protein